MGEEWVNLQIQVQEIMEIMKLKLTNIRFANEMSLTYVV